MREHEPLPIESIRPRNRSWILKAAIKLRALIFLVAAFVAINFHVLTQNATTMPPHSLAFGPYVPVEPELQSQTPGYVSRPLAGYYTADPTGTFALVAYQRFALDSLAHGEIPFWNPYTLTGLPFLAEFQWAVFYPPSWLRFLIPEGWWDLYSALHVLLLGLIVYALARSAYGNHRNALFAGAAVFGIGFILLYFPTDTLIVVAPWGALLVLGFERLIRRLWHWTGLLLTAAGVVGLGTAGHPTPAIFWLFAVMVYIAARRALDRHTARALVPFFLVGGLAALAAAPNVLPFFTYASAGDTFTKSLSSPFYTLRDLFTLLFPYVFGPINSIQPAALLAEGVLHMPGFLLPVPFIMFPAFIGAWTALKRRKSQLIALMISALVIVLWAFGVPPVAWLSNLPLLGRLSFTYAWIIPSIAICLLAGYGYGVISQSTPVLPRKPIILFLCVYFGAALAVLGYVWHAGVIKDFVSSRGLLLSGLVPSLGFAILGPLLVLVLLPRFDRHPAPHLRAQLLGSVLWIGLGLNVAAAYPSANPFRESRLLPLAALAALCVVIIVFAALARAPKFSNVRRLVHPAVALIVVAGFVAISNRADPGLPERYEIVRVPEFINQLYSDRLNWRVYGMNGAVPFNNLVRYGISAFNNQNALVPPAWRSFVASHLDSEQDPTQFYGLPWQPWMDPPAEYLRNIRYWEYIGVRYLAVSAAEYPAGSPDFWRALGYESTAAAESELVAIPQVSQDDPRLGLRQHVDCSEGPFSAVRIKLGTSLRTNPGRIVLAATSGGRHLLARGVIDSTQIRDAQFQLISLSREVCRDPSSQLDLSIYHLGGQPGLDIAAWRSGDRSVDILRVFTWSPSASPRLRLAYADDETGVAVFEDSQAAPRAYFTNRFSVAPDSSAAQVQFSQLDDLRSVAYGDDPKTACSSAPTGAGYPNTDDTSVRITDLRSSSISITAQVPSAGTLVLVDTFMPGWTAVVDGSPAPVLRINGVFRGVCLGSAGTHTVTMQYRPPYWNFALILAAVGGAGLALLLIYALRRSHNART